MSARILSLLVSIALAASVRAQTAATPPTPPADPAVKLDKFIVDSSKTGLSTLPLDSIANTGSRLDIPIRELPASMSVVSQDLMSARGLRTQIEAVESAVGMAGGLQDGSIPYFATRGFSNNAITVLRDGIRPNTAAQHARPFDTFHLDRIEILKGPASVLFGEGAIGGAVNYVSKSPDRTPTATGLASYGSFDTRRVGLGAGGPAGAAGSGFFYRFDASHSSSDGYMPLNSWELSELSGAFRWEPNSALSLTLFLDYAKDDTETYYGTPLVNGRIDDRTRRQNYNIADNFAQSKNFRGRALGEWKPTENLRLRNEVYGYTHSLDWRNFEFARYLPATNQVQLEEFLLLLRDDQLVGNRFDVQATGELFGRPVRGVAGFDVHRNELERGQFFDDTEYRVDPFSPGRVNGPAVGAPKNFRTADVTVDTAAFFAEEYFEATDRLKLVTGIRYENIEVDRLNLAARTTASKRFRPFTWRFGAVFQARKDANLYAQFSKAAEPVIQLVSLNTNRVDFGLQKGDQYEVGLKQGFWSGRADLTVALFNIERRDILTQNVVNNVRLTQQVGRQTAQGIELALALQPASGWRIEANYAYTEAEFEEFNENLGAGVVSRSGNRSPNVPAVIANLYVSKTWSNGFTLSGGPRHVGRSTVDNANSYFLENYTVLDAAVSYAWQNWEVALRGRNLTDEVYAARGRSSGTAVIVRLADPVSAEFSVRARF